MPPKRNSPAKTDSARRREERFVEEYLIDLNGRHAAIRAGYAPAGAATTASQLLKMSHIASAIDAAIAERSARTNIRADEILEELRVLAKSSLEHYEIDDYGHVVLKPDAPPGAMRAVSRIKRTVRTFRHKDGTEETTRDTELALWDKNPALKMAGQHLAMFTEVKKVSGQLDLKQTWKIGDKEITF